MCLDPHTVEKLVAPEIINVFKVFKYMGDHDDKILFEEYCILPFHSIIQLSADKMQMVESKNLVGVLKYETTEPGYHCFLDEKIAEAYIMRLITECRMLRDENLVIIDLQIPKGYSYENGKIKSSYWGSGLSAVRSRKLCKPT